MSLQKYESKVQHIAHPNASVYAVLSDFTRLKALGQLLQSEEYAALIEQRLGKEKAAGVAEKLREIELTEDTAGINVPPVGPVTVRIVEREEPKLVKLAFEGLPVNAWIWLQLLPDENDGTRLKVTTGADVSFFLKGMADKYLSPMADNMAQILASLPYDKL
jgi:carbon monoxide dehydrogenase subunit G